ncbi:MAG: hypothetical protein AAFR56_21220, partial [Chloroflexota bacterium]
MIGTQVVDRADQKHTRLERPGLTGRVACASGQRCQRLTKGGIQALDEGDPTALRALQQTINRIRMPLRDA